MTHTPRLRLFLSHAHDEASLALALQQRIEADFLGLVQVWVSSNRRNLLPGDDWLDSLKTKINEADICGVLASNRSLGHPWVNIEVGAAFFRAERPMILPLCHSDLAPGALESPLDRKQAIAITTEPGVRALYECLAQALGCRVPGIHFGSMAESLKAFEIEYNAASQRKDESAHQPAGERESSAQLYPEPAVLCISSRQFESSAQRDLELIRSFLPSRLNHHVAVSSDEVREELGTRSYDIIHTALYICPLAGDLVFSDIDPETKQHVGESRDVLTAEDFGRLLAVARTSLLVISTPEPLSFVAKMLPFTNIVFPSGPVEPEPLARWMGAFYKLLALPATLAEACKRASAQHCSCMMLYPKLHSASAGAKNASASR